MELSAQAVAHLIGNLGRSFPGEIRNVPQQEGRESPKKEAGPSRVVGGFNKQGPY